MRCPFCKNKDTNVKDSRTIDDDKSTRRRRECPACKMRFTTFEKVQLRELFVFKRSGIRKKFDKMKIVSSILTAVRKRNVSDHDIEKIAEDITCILENSATGEITTRKIGEMIMKSLAAIDQVSYIRFASVYKDFSSLSDFAKFISRIKK